MQDYQDDSCGYGFKENHTQSLESLFHSTKFTGNRKRGSRRATREQKYEIVPLSHQLTIGLKGGSMVRVENLAYRKNAELLESVTHGWLSRGRRSGHLAHGIGEVGDHLRHFLQRPASGRAGKAPAEPGPPAQDAVV